MYTLNPDVYLTRRKRMHFVMNHQGDLAWSGKTIIGALEYLFENGQSEFTVEGQEAERSFQVMSSPD